MDYPNRQASMGTGRGRHSSKHHGSVYPLLDVRTAADIHPVDGDRPKVLRWRCSSEIRFNALLYRGCICRSQVDSQENHISKVPLSPGGTEHPGQYPDRRHTGRYRYRHILFPGGLAIISVVNKRRLTHKAVNELLEHCRCEIKGYSKSMRNKAVTAEHPLLPAGLSTHELNRNPRRWLKAMMSLFYQPSLSAERGKSAPAVEPVGQLRSFSCKP